MDDRTWGRRRWWRVRRLLAVLSMAMLTIGGTQLVAATSADAATTTIYLVTKRSPGGSEPHREAFARCHPGDMLVGGGAGLSSSPPMTLTRIQPVVTPSPLVDDGMRATGEETRSGYGGGWEVIAQAICAKPGGAVRDVELVSAVTGPSRERFQQTAAVCPSGKRALGSGAAVRTLNGAVGNGNNQLGLQLNRTSGPMDISRAAAAATTATPAQWSLISYAICARPIDGAVVHGGLGHPPGNEYYTCPQNKRVLSVGGGGPLHYPGQAFLFALESLEDLRQFSVGMVGLPDGQIAIGAVCAPV
jgi:hypothetical protein